MRLRHLQRHLPWTLPYSPDFYRSHALEGHRNLLHDLMHIQKSLGKIAAVAEDIDHGRPLTRMTREAFAREVADLVIGALHIAITNPLGEFDLEATVVECLETWNGVKIPPSDSDPRRPCADPDCLAEECDCSLRQDQRVYCPDCAP